MQRTEVESTKTVCPETISTGAATCCIGTFCMAWRWDGWRDQDNIVTTTRAHRDDVRVGYCGKAGKP